MTYIVDFIMVLHNSIWQTKYSICDISYNMAPYARSEGPRRIMEKEIIPVHFSVYKTSEITQYICSTFD